MLLEKEFKLKSQQSKEQENNEKLIAKYNTYRKALT